MDEDVKAAVLRLCAKGEALIDLTNEILQREYKRMYGMPTKWEHVIGQSGLDDAGKETLRAIVQQVLDEKSQGPP